MEIVERNKMFSKYVNDELTDYINSFINKSDNQKLIFHLSVKDHAFDEFTSDKDHYICDYGIDSYYTVLNMFDKIFELLYDYDKLMDYIMYNISIYDPEEILNTDNIRFTYEECINYNKLEMIEKLGSSIFRACRFAYLDHYGDSYYGDSDYINKRTRIRKISNDFTANIRRTIADIRYLSKYVPNYYQEDHRYLF